MSRAVERFEKQLEENREQIRERRAALAESGRLVPVERLRYLQRAAGRR